LLKNAEVKNKFLKETILLFSEFGNVTKQCNGISRYRLCCVRAKTLRSDKSSNIRQLQEAISFLHCAKAFCDIKNCNLA
jgi:hypothetical protein